MENAWEKLKTGAELLKTNSLQTFMFFSMLPKQSKEIIDHISLIKSAVLYMFLPID